ncbi:unnamed protein product [Rhizophagus irregularis]|nr:unnamed protein product [Rhizophagus irregularis]CAB4443952.1 unnamed protein product [Rhizophagus irregularis]
MMLVLPISNVALKEYPYLSLYNSYKHNDGYEFKTSSLCSGCGKEHNKGIKGSYYIKCRSSPNEKEIKINASPGMISSSTSSSGQARSSNKSRLPISILPEDPEEEAKTYHWVGARAVSLSIFKQ